MARRLDPHRLRLLVAAGLYVLAAAALLLPALLNGFPLVMGDTWRYVREADGHYSWASSHFYSYVLWLVSGTSLWVVVALQAAAALAVVAAFFRRVLGATHVHAALAATLLALTSTLGFFASLVMTDLVLGLGLVAAATLLLGHGRRVGDVTLALGVAFVTAAHPVALPLFVLLMLACLVAVLVVRARRRRWSGLGRVALLGGGLAAGVVALTISNAIVWEKPTPNPHSAVATFAYLYYQGDLDRQLAQCERWDVCDLPRTAPRQPDRPTLFAFGSRDLSEFNWFLFDDDTSVLWREYGGPTEFAPRARAIVADHARTEPVAYARRIGSSGWEQLFSIRALEHMEWMMRYLGGRHSALLATHNEGDPPRFEAGRQFRKTLDLGWSADVARVFTIAGALAAAGAGLLATGAAVLRRRPLAPVVAQAAVASLSLLSLYVVHAFVVGTSTYPTPRYGGRVSWLLVLALWALVYAALELRRPRVHEDDVAEPAHGQADIADGGGRAHGARETG